MGQQGGLGVPARRLAVALSATSPRSFLAAGFSLQSLTQAILIGILLLVPGQVAFGQSGIEGHYVFAPGIGATELYLHPGGTYRYYAFGCTAQSTDTGSYFLSRDTLVFKSLYADTKSRNASLRLVKGTTRVPALKDSILVCLANKSPQPAYDLKLSCSAMVVEEIDSFPKATTLYYRIPVSMLKADSTITLEMGSDRLEVDGQAVIVLEVHGENKYQSAPLNERFTWRGNELCLIINDPQYVPACLTRQ